MIRTTRRLRKTSKRVRDGHPQHNAASCWHHGSCPWCRGNRTHGAQRREPEQD